MRGVQLIAAMTLVVELLDFLRFENPSWGFKCSLRSRITRGSEAPTRTRTG